GECSMGSATLEGKIDQQGVATHAQRLGTTAPSLNEPRAKTLKLDIRDRTGLLQLIEFGDFVGHAEADHTAQVLARLLGLLNVTIGHPSSLCDQIREDGEVRGENQRNHP